MVSANWTNGISNAGYTVRHLIPENLSQAKVAMLIQLRSLLDVKNGSTRDRVSQTGFFLGLNKEQLTYKIER